MSHGHRRQQCPIVLWVLQRVPHSLPQMPPQKLRLLASAICSTAAKEFRDTGLTTNKVTIKINKSLFQQCWDSSTIVMVSVIQQLFLIHKLSSADEGMVLCACLGNSQGISQQRKALATCRFLNARHIRIRVDALILFVFHMLANSQR